MKYLQDDDGNQSTMRLVWAVSVLVIIGTWSYVSISGGQLQNFQLGDAMFIGVLFGGKVAQKYMEGKNGKTKK